MSLSPVGTCYLFQPSIQLSCVIHCVVIPPPPPGHSFNIHCLLPAIDVFLFFTIMIHHWHALLTITMCRQPWPVYFICLLPPDSLLLHVMSYPTVMYFSPFTCVINPPDVFSNCPHEPVELLIIDSIVYLEHNSVVHHNHELLMVLSTTNMSYELSHCVVHHEHKL